MEKTLYFGKLHLPKSGYNSHESLESLTLFLDAEKQNNLQDNWSKLDKTVKIKKLLDFVDMYSVENSLDEDEKLKLNEFLKDSLDRKKINKVKDVNYDKKKGVIKSINGLVYYKSQKRFSFKMRSKEEENLKEL
jgi:hypothetical protein